MKEIGKFGPRLKHKDEEYVESYKNCIGEDGYGWIKEKLYRIKGFYEDDIVLQHCHLLSIARHEVERETGKITSDTAGSCGLCLFHRPDLSIFYGCENCVMWGGVKDICCYEYAYRHRDNGKALIERLRQTFMDKYYKEDKMDTGKDVSEMYCKKETTMKTDILEVLLQPLKRDYWVFQVLEMDERCRGLKEFMASNGWRIKSQDCPEINTYLKRIFTHGSIKKEDYKPTIAKQNNTTFAEIKQALEEWAVWAREQIGEAEIIVGSKVNVIDNSGMMIISDGRVQNRSEYNGYLSNRNPHTVLALEGRFPTNPDSPYMTKHKLANDVMIRTLTGEIAFTYTKHISLVGQISEVEKKEESNDNIIRV